MIFTHIHSFTVNQEKLENLSIWGFLLRSGYAILVKIWKSLKLLNAVPFIKQTLVNHVYIRIWGSWLTFTVLQWIKTNFKISQFSRFLWNFEYAIEVKISKKTKTSSFCSIHQENTCQSSLYSNLMILTHFHSFTVNQDKLQN